MLGCARKLLSLNLCSAGKTVECYISNLSNNCQGHVLNLKVMGRL